MEWIRVSRLEWATPRKRCRWLHINGAPTRTGCGVMIDATGNACGCRLREYSRPLWRRDISDCMVQSRLFSVLTSELYLFLSRRLYKSDATAKTCHVLSDCIEALSIIGENAERRTTRITNRSHFATLCRRGREKDVSRCALPCAVKVGGKPQLQVQMQFLTSSNRTRSSDCGCINRGTWCRQLCRNVGNDR